MALAVRVEHDAAAVRRPNGNTVETRIERETGGARRVQKPDIAVLPCTVRDTATRRPSGERLGTDKLFASGAPMVPSALPERSNQVSCRWPAPPDR